MLMHLEWAFSCSTGGKIINVRTKEKNEQDKNKYLSLESECLKVVSVRKRAKCRTRVFRCWCSCCGCHLLSQQHSAIFGVLVLRETCTRCENHFTRSTKCIKWTKKCDEVQSHCARKTGKKTRWSKLASFHVLNELSKWKCQDREKASEQDFIR